MSLVFGAYMKLAMFERQSVSRYQLKQQATLAAESLASYATAEVIEQFENLPRVEFENYTSGPIEISDSAKSALLSPNIDPDSLEVVVTTFDEEGNETYSFESLYIDADNRAYMDDPEKGDWVLARTLRIYASATAKNTSDSDSGQSAFVEQVIQLRYNSFLDYIIFCYDDLEFMPEEYMLLDGDVHTNADLYVSSTNGLDFGGKVTASGRFTHGVKYLDGAKFEKALGDVRIKNPNIEIGEDEDESAKFLSILRDDEDSQDLALTDPFRWIDNNELKFPDNAADTTWETEMDALWDGYLKDGADKVTLPGIVASPETNDNFVAIEPTVSVNEDNDQKYSYLSGLVLKVEGTAREGDKPYESGTGDDTDGFTASDYTVRAFIYNDDDGDGQPDFNADGTPSMTEVRLPDGLIGDANYSMTSIENDAVAEGFENITGNYATTTLVPEYEEIETVTLVPLEDRIESIEVWYEKKVEKTNSKYDNMEYGSDVVSRDDWEEEREEELETWEVRKERKIARAERNAEDGFIESTTTELALDENGDPIQATDDEGNLLFEEVSDQEPYEYVAGGFFDYRENKYMDALYLDIGRLHELVNDWTPPAESNPEDDDDEGRDEDDDEDDDDDDDDDESEEEELTGWAYTGNSGSGPATFNPDTHWNGAVYLELPYTTETLTHTEVIDGSTVTQEATRYVSSDPNLGVVLINGKDLPNQVKDSGYDEGFTFATNGPVYLVGNYNADGDSTTGSSTQAEDGTGDQAHEVPALIVAETFTALSPEFADAEPVPSSPANYNDESDEVEIFDATGRRQLYDNARSHNAAMATSTVEIAAGLILGISPTDADEGTQSGGGHNLIRLQQNWQPNDDTATHLIYRGAIVALFETMVHDSTLPEDYEVVFSAPARDLMHSPLFADGILPVMPELPKSFRRMSVKQVYEDEYKDRYAKATATADSEGS
ncbi:MAG: hypothetical protein ACPGN3_17210 [Opitutales bacterium]